MRDNMLNNEYYEHIFKQFKTDRPFDAKHAIGYRPLGEHKIRVELDDTTHVDYTYIEGYGKYVRERPRSIVDITREYVHNEFADRLRDMMVRKGFNQKALSEVTGIAQGTISSYLRRNEAYKDCEKKQPVNPTIDKVYIMAAALGCDPYELM